ncbi:MAG: hypothetical protein WC994_07005 [Brumimicrobium sp.]
MNLTKIIKGVLTLIFMVSAFTTFSQSNLRIQTIPAPELSDTITIDSLTIYQNSFGVFCGDYKLSENDYYFNGNTREFALKNDCSDSLWISYRVFSVNFEKVYQSVDTSIIYKNEGQKEDFFFRDASFERENFFSGDGINKSGSISRGINFGNAQDLSVNSTLNLQLSGEISDNVNVLATVTDDNLPIQPEGNTNQLQEFDQVFIQLFGKEYKVIAGDFWLHKPNGYFMNYNKRAQGLFGEYSFDMNKNNSLKIQASGALSKGKFARNVIQGVEGNQGPYRLKGNENEPYIIVLSGTESVYLNGKLLERGQDLDYIIDYNTSEVTFTSRHHINKDSRIVVEFQYTDQNYARSLFQGGLDYKSEKVDVWFNVYSEQDAKNQSLQQQLSDADKLLLSQVGDSLDLAFMRSIDSIGFADNQVVYLMTDSLGYDSVLVHSVDPNLAHYRAVFTEVGHGKGNYVFDKFTAVGRVFKWVEPIGGIPQGNYEPIRLMVAPKKRMMMSLGTNYRLSDRWQMQTEFSLSNNDKNTFSKFDNEDNLGYSNFTLIEGNFKLGRDKDSSKWSLKTAIDFEYTSRYFEEIERYRGVEFDRDWNVRGKDYQGDEILANLSARIMHNDFGSFELKGQNFTFGNDFQGNRGQFLASWEQKGFKGTIDASFLGSRAENHANTFARHQSSLSQAIGPIRIGFEDKHERNAFVESDTLLKPNSYQWYEWKVFLSNSEKLENAFNVFYKERYDWRSDSTSLKNAAVARDIGADYNWVTNQHSRLTTMVSYRSLTIENENLIAQAPENTFIGRLDYQLNLWKNALTSSTFYEVGSGLELKKEFLYIEVNTGRGVYTWIDYNGDGVKDLNEFEIAQYPDQANYIRMYIPSDDYVSTYSNEFNQTLSWRPERIWNNKKRFLKLLSRVSNQTRFRVRKKMDSQTFEVYNPLARNIADSTLINYSSMIRNTLSINRTDPIWGADYVYSQNATKALLANGFDAKNSTFHSINARWNMIKQLTFKINGQIGEKKSIVDYTTGRDYFIKYHNIKPELVYQPGTKFRVSLNGRYEEKRNQEDFGGETSYIGDIGLELKWNQLEKGSLTAELKFVNIKYNGTESNSLAYEMLESLKPGENFTWGLNYQWSISRNLQINIQYNGRKSEKTKAIHAGGVEVRAFF